jgi:hypothetical protein
MNRSRRNPGLLTATVPPIAYPYQIADVLNGQANVYQSLAGAGPVAMGPDGLPLFATPVLGENGTAFISGNTGVTSVNLLGSGSINWTYQAPTGTRFSIVTVTSGNGLAAKATDQSGMDTVSQFDASGNITAPMGTAMGTSYSWQGQWNGFMSNTPLASLLLAQTTASALSSWVQPFSNPSSTGTSVKHHSFGLFWCGTEYGETGSCTRNPEQVDIPFDYIANGPNVVFYHPLSSYNPVDFSSSNPQFVDAIESSALKAFQTAFNSFGIVVQRGSTHAVSGVHAGSRISNIRYRIMAARTWKIFRSASSRV